MKTFALRKEKHKAQILQVLKCVMSHFSLDSSTDITDIFKAIFLDSAIAQKMKFGPKKLSYRTDWHLCEVLQQRQSSLQVSHLNVFWSYLCRRSKEGIRRRHPRFRHEENGSGFHGWTQCLLDTVLQHSGRKKSKG